MQLTYIFFIYFLTDFAGISPAIAGTISLIAVWWDAITDPAIGYISDNARFKSGRRRPFILVGSVLLGLSVFLLYNNVQLSMTLKITYFVISNILFWTFFTLTDIPYIALGAELSTDYNEKTKIRSYASIFLNLGVLIASSATFPLIFIFAGETEDFTSAWRSVGILYAVIVFVSFLISWFSTKGKEVVTVNKSNENRVGLLKQFKSILTVKPLRYLILIALFMNIGFGLNQAMGMYNMGYVLGFDEMTISTIYLLSSIYLVLIVIPIGYVAMKVSKKAVLIFGFVAFLLGGLSFMLIPSGSYMGTLVWRLFMDFGNASFFTLIYAIAYDIAQFDVIKSGEHREGLITSFVNFFVKFGTAIGMWIAGMGLTIVRYNPELFEQTAETLSGMRLLTFSTTGVMAIICIVIFVKYPSTLVKESIEKNSSLIMEN